MITGDKYLEDQIKAEQEESKSFNRSFDSKLDWLECNDSKLLNEKTILVDVYLGRVNVAKSLQ